MQHPPRNAAKPILDGFLLWRIALVSSVLIVGTISVFLWELQRGEPLEVSRTAAINALVMGQIFYLLSVRQDTAAAWVPRNLGGNISIYAAIATVICLQLLFSYWGPMTELFGTAPVDGLAWAWALMIGILVFLTVEIEKTWRRRDTSRSRRLQAKAAHPRRY